MPFPSSFLSLLLTAAFLTLAFSQSYFPCHPTKADSNKGVTCKQVVLPPALCKRCPLRPTLRDGRFEDCTRVYDTTSEDCHQALEEYVDENGGCDPVRKEALPKMIDGDERARTVIDYFLYSICEQCCDCIPMGTKSSDYDDLASSHSSSAPTLWKEDRGNCPAHANFDVCRVLPNIRSFAKPGDPEVSAPEACPMLKKWQNSKEAKEWETNPQTNIVPELNTFLNGMLRAIDCDDAGIWSRCYEMEDKQNHLGLPDDFVESEDDTPTTEAPTTTESSTATTTSTSSTTDSSTSTTTTSSTEATDATETTPTTTTTTTSTTTEVEDEDDTTSSTSPPEESPSTGSTDTTSSETSSSSATTTDTDPTKTPTTTTSTTTAGTSAPSTTDDSTETTTTTGTTTTTTTTASPDTDGDTAPESDSEDPTADSDTPSGSESDAVGDSGEESSSSNTSESDASGEEPTSSIEGSTASCFPGSASVELESGVKIGMSELRIGDSVRVGKDTFSEVFLFSHRTTGSAPYYIEISNEASEKRLRATSGHFLHVNGELVAAGLVKVGDRILSADNGWVRVTGVRRVSGSGLYNPQTIQGDIVVDGYVSSTYTSAIPRAIATGLLAPLRALYQHGFVSERVFGRFLSEGYTSLRKEL